MGIFKRKTQAQAQTNTLALTNSTEAIARIGGNTGLYLKLLASFKNGNNLCALLEAVEKGDTSGAIHWAHTIKGVAANLSLLQLWQMAAELEESFKAGERSPTTLPAFQQCMKQTLQEIDSETLKLGGVI